METFHLFRLGRPAPGPGEPLPDRLGDCPQFRGQEVFAVGVLGQFACHEVVEVHDMDGDVLPPQEFGGLQPALPGDEPVARVDHYRVQEAEPVQGLGQGGQVAQVFAVARSDLDRANGSGVGHGSPGWRVGTGPPGF